LRHELTQRLGVEWQPVVKGIADIQGFSREELRRFSTRRAEILEAAGEGASARAMQVATLATRKAKDRDLTTESLREAWRTNSAEVGLDRDAIGTRLGYERPSPTLLTALQVERSVTAHASHFDRREAIQVVADNLPHGAPAAEVEQLADAFLASDSVMRISEGPKGDRFTTPADLGAGAAGAGGGGADAGRCRSGLGRPDHRLPRPRCPAELEGRSAGNGLPAPRRRPGA
jgi:hypothetical protein